MPGSASIKKSACNAAPSLHVVLREVAHARCQQHFVVEEEVS